MDHGHVSMSYKMGRRGGNGPGRKRVLDPKDRMMGLMSWGMGPETEIMEQGVG